MNKSVMKKIIPIPVKKILLTPYSKIIKIRKLINSNRILIDAKLHPSKAVYHCPCCNNSFRNYKAGFFIRRSDLFNPERYKGIRQEVMCPICGSIPRHRILTLWMQNQIEELKKGSILYFAIEDGIKIWLNHKDINVTTADLFKHADLRLNLESIDQPDNSWDWIVCNHVLEHVDNYHSALHELYRILRPGGRLIVSFPILESLPTLIEEIEHTEANKKKRIELYGQADHLRIFGADSEEILRKAGFIVSRIDGSKMPEKIMPVVGPADYDVNYLFLCKKPE